MNKKSSSSYWLLKSEPFKYPFERLVSDKSTHWDGVRNFEARNNLRAMKRGDLCLFYHSNEGKSVVGVAEIAKEAYQDPTTDEDWSVVDVKPVKALASPVSLDVLKTDPRTNGMAVVKRSRLSVTAVTADEFKAVLALGKTKL